MNFDASVLQVAIEDIIPNRFQPRLVFDDTSLNELAESIKQHGIIQPLVLRRIGEKYEIVAGERRYRAAKMAGLVSVPAVVSRIDDQKSAEIAISENVQRKELTGVEEAKSYKALLDEGYMTESQLAARLGLSEMAIANKLKLLTLAPEVQRAVLEGKISERHARSLLAVKDQEAQVKWLSRIINERLTVRMLDLELRKEYGEIYMNNGLDIEKIKNNATDIPITPVQSVSAQNEINVGPINLGQKQTNKFFNNLENEAVNMQMTEAVNPFMQQNSMFDLSSTQNSGFVNNEPQTTMQDSLPQMNVNPSIEPNVNQPSMPAPLPVQEAIEPSMDSLDVMPSSNPASFMMPNPEIQTKTNTPNELFQATPNVTQNTSNSPISTLDQVVSQPTNISQIKEIPDQLVSNQYMNPIQNNEVVQQPVASVGRSLDEAKSKVNKLVEELQALGYIVNNSTTEMNGSASFTIMVNIN